MSGNPVTWFEIYVQDAPRARRFYEATLAVTLAKLDTPVGDVTGMWSFPAARESHGATGALVKMDGVGSGGGGTIVYFECADCAVEAGRVTANGGTIVKPKFAIGQYGFIALATDTEGNMIGLHSMK